MFHVTNILYLFFKVLPSMLDEQFHNLLEDCGYWFILEIVQIGRIFPTDLELKMEK